MAQLGAQSQPIGVLVKLLDPTDSDEVTVEAGRYVGSLQQFRGQSDGFGQLAVALKTVLLVVAEEKKRKIVKLLAKF